MLKSVTVVRLCVETFLAAGVGALEIFIMRLADTDSGWDRFEFLYPLIVGFLIGLVGRAPIWIVGPATMLCMPIGMVVSTITGGSSLNLWPIALMFYAILGLIGFAGAVAGRGAKHCWIKWGLRHDA
jgi:RsiW-degrading membrane proteinase PrsW (M82 family)